MRIVPPPLEPGDAIGIVAPAGYNDDRRLFESGCSIIADMGFEVFNRDSKWPGFGYLADTDEARLRELHTMWSNSEVKAIVALRGGYGTLRLVGGIDCRLIRRNPKLFIGFSDITILHNYLYQQTGLVSLHGPLLTTLGSSDRESLERLYHCLRGNWHADLAVDVEIVRDAPTVSGTLMGGNLSSLVTLLGTSFSIDLRDAILFLEDVNEPAYRLDRMLTHLYHSNAFGRLRGIILGDFCDDGRSSATERLRLHEFVWNRVAELTSGQDLPIWGNFPCGHRSRNIALPIGVVTHMDSSRRRLRFMPAPYQD